MNTKVLKDNNPKALNRREFKNLLRQYFTVHRPIVNGCGHHINLESDPKGNCEKCWFTWFNQHGELVQSVDEMIRQHGSATIVAMRGLKFLKNYRKFMSTVARWKAQVEAVKAAKNGIQENDVKGVTGTNSGAAANGNEESGQTEAA